MQSKNYPIYFKVLNKIFNICQDDQDKDPFKYGGANRFIYHHHHHHHHYHYYYFYYY